MKTLKCTLLLVSVVFCASKYSAQSRFNNPVDTLHYQHRTGGDIDTMDLTFLKSLSLLPGLGFNHQYNLPSYYLFSSNPLLQANIFFTTNDQMTFSGLPHLGFFYSFGSKGTQVLHADYQQVFKGTSILNLKLDRQSGTGFVRNGVFNASDFELKFQRNGTHWKTTVLGRYKLNTAGLNGGVLDTASYLAFGGEFAAVRKSNATSSNKQGAIDWTNHLFFSSDSTHRRTHGLLTNHFFDLNNRTYSEIDSISKLYPNTYLNADTTADQYQMNDLTNGIGYFVSTPTLELSGLLNQRYRRIQNLGSMSDTLEYSAKFSGQYKKGKLRIVENYYQNMYGAEGELSSKTSLQYMDSTWSMALLGKYERMLPNMLQRAYRSNNLNYLLPNLALQTTIDLQGDLDFRLSNVFSIQLNAGYLSRKNVLTWSGNDWSNGKYASFDLTHGKLQTTIEFKGLRFSPFAQINKGLDFLPDLVYGARVSYKKRVFKAKKMELLMALDAVQNSRYRLMDYNNLLDVYVMNETNTLNSGYYSLYATFGFAIEEFRFFLRAENLQTTFQSKLYPVAVNYFNSSFAMRIGITWDFIN